MWERRFSSVCELHVAAVSGQTNLVELLVQHGASLAGTNTDGLTPLGLLQAAKAFTRDGQPIDVPSAYLPGGPKRRDLIPQNRVAPAVMMELLRNLATRTPGPVAAPRPSTLAPARGVPPSPSSTNAPARAVFAPSPPPPKRKLP